MNKRILKKAEQDLKKANKHRRKRILTLDEIEDEIYDKVQDLLKQGMKKKYLNRLTIYNSHSLPKSYKYSAYYTHYCATLNKNGDIRKLIISEDSCYKKSYGRYDVNYNINLKDNDSTPYQIKESLKKQIICGNL